MMEMPCVCGAQFDDVARKRESFDRAGMNKVAVETLDPIVGESDVAVILVVSQVLFGAQQR